MPVFEDKDLGIEILSKDEDLWTKVRDARAKSIETLEEALIVEREILKLAETKLKKAKK